MKRQRLVEVVARTVILALPCALVGTGLAQAAPGNAAGKALGAPQRLADGREPINVDIGHAAPAVLDFNGDGKKDLLVGQFGGGKLRIYLNKGTSAEPKFEGFTYLSINGKEVTVPHG